jgi:UDP-N-acetyl-D-galactosamine dehydrogenase
MIGKGIQPIGARVLVLGLTFKENCPDVRNTKVVDLIHGLTAYRCEVSVFDPWASEAEAKEEYGIDLAHTLEQGGYDAVVVAVSHKQFAELGGAGVRALGAPNSVVYDVKHLLPVEFVDGRL